MKIIIGLVLLQAIVYTWVHLYLSYKVGMEIAPTTSVAFYTMCAGELGVCGWLKKSTEIGKSKKKMKKEDDVYGETYQTH